MAARQNYYAESDADSTTTSTTYQDKTTLTFTPDANSDYYMICCALLNSSSATDDWKARLQNTTGATTLVEQTVDLIDTDEYYTFAGIAKETFGASPAGQTYKIQFGAEANAPTITIRDARVIAIKKGTNDQDAATDTETTAAGTTYEDLTTLTFTPGSQGDYLIVAFAECNTDQSSSSTVGFITLDIDGTDYSEMRVEGNGIDDWEVWMAVKRVNLTAASHTIKIQIREISPPQAGDFKVRKARIFAIRMDAFDNNYFAEAETRTTTTSTTYQDKTTLTATPVAVNHVIMASALFDNNTSGVEWCGIKLIETATDISESFEHSNSASNNQMCFFAMYRKSLVATSTTWKTQWRTEVNDTVGHDDSRISIVQLDVEAAAGVKGIMLRAGMVIPTV